MASRHSWICVIVPWVPSFASHADLSFFEHCLTAFFWSRQRQFLLMISVSLSSETGCLSLPWVTAFEVSLPFNWSWRILALHSESLFSNYWASWCFWMSLFSLRNLPMTSSVWFGMSMLSILRIIFLSFFSPFMSFDVVSSLSSFWWLISGFDSLTEFFWSALSGATVVTVWISTVVSAQLE